MTTKIEFNATEPQTRALNSNKRYIWVTSGIQGGKTTVGAYWLLCKVMKNPKGHYLVGFPTYKIFEQSTYVTLSPLFKDFGKMRWQRGEFETHQGGKIFFRSAEKPNTIEGIPNVEAVWLDEVGQIKHQAWINYEGRSSIKMAQILGTTTPYSLNWLYKDFIRPIQKGERDDCEWINFASIENPAFPREEFDRQKKLLKPEVFRRRYLGEFVRLEGLVYELHEQENYVPKDFAVPDRCIYFGGVDWGYASSPFALLVMAYDPEFDYLYLVSEFKKSGLTPTEVFRIVGQKQKIYNCKFWACDSSRPEMIAELGQYGCAAFGATHEIEQGVEVVREFVNTRKLKVLRGLVPQTDEEFELYVYPEHTNDMKEITNKPVPVHNHLMDCLRYGVWHMQDYRKTRLTKPTQSVQRLRELEQQRRDDPMKRIEWLKKRSKDKRRGYLGGR